MPDELSVPEFQVVDRPLRNRNNRTVAKLADMLKGLPEDKAIIVTPEQFGWTCDGLPFLSSLNTAFKRAGIRIWTKRQGGHVYIGRKREEKTK